MFISMFVKQNFLVVISHLYDSLIQVYYLKAKPIPALSTERHLPRYPEEPLVASAEEVKPPEEVVYEFAERIQATTVIPSREEIQDFMLLLLKSFQYHPESIIDMHELQRQVEEVVDGEIKRFADVEAAVIVDAESLSEQKN